MWDGLGEWGHFTEVTKYIGSSSVWRIEAQVSPMTNKQKTLPSHKST